MLPFWPNVALFSLIVASRYLVFAGGAYLFFYRWRRRQWHHKKIVPEFPPRSVIWAEFRGSLITSVIFAFAGALVVEAYKSGGTALYLDWREWGVAYLFLQLPVLLLLHDTYFYFLHRWLHRPALYRAIHHTHHLSRAPTPWAAFSFHPVESVLEALILPALVFVIPVYVPIFLGFLILMTVSSVINHLGYELFPKGFAKAPLFRHWITATHHNEHHMMMSRNFGLYFTFWDRLLKTQSHHYETTFDEIAHRVTQGA